jgi:hypothetical protein
MISILDFGIAPAGFWFRERWPIVEANLESRSDLSIPQRKEYIQAVLCLQSKAPISPRDKFPGAKNRYDDFVAAHQSLAIMLHSTVSPVFPMFWIVFG